MSASRQPTIEINNELSSLKSTVDQLAEDSGWTKSSLEELVVQSKRTLEMLERFLIAKNQDK